MRSENREGVSDLRSAAGETWVSVLTALPSGCVRLGSLLLLPSFLILLI